MNAYLDYFDLTDRKGWRLQDLPWNTPDLEKVTDEDRKAVLATSIIESGVPHYAKLWEMVDGFFADWELAQFVTLWAGEEERHNVALHKLVRTLGLDDKGEYDRVATFDFPRAQKAQCPTRCYENVPGMLTYTVLQELVTWKFYTSAARQSKSRLVRDTFNLIGQDEMRHHVWYRDALKARYEKTSGADREWFCDQVVAAVQHFIMPHGIFHLQEKYFDQDSSVVGRLGIADIKLKAARALSFDRSILARVARGPISAEAELAQV